MDVQYFDCRIGAICFILSRDQALQIIDFHGDEDLQRRIEELAEKANEGELQIEHILPRKHGGSDDLANLALACIDSNLHKGANLTGINPETGRVIELFNPRSQRWSEHFAWTECPVVGLTAAGRTTIRVLDINAEDRIRVRLAEASIT